MAELREVPTDELLSFQEFPPVHTANNPHLDAFSSAQLDIHVPKHDAETFSSLDKGSGERNDPLEQNADSTAMKSFWTIEYYQQFFDVDTKDVVDRLIASVTPLRNNTLKNQIKVKPDLYGPFWISTTLIFTIAISGNLANYLQHDVKSQYHWKYDFHLVSYVATAIILYISLVPLSLWGLLKWTSKAADLEALDSETPSTLEIICVYGYSLFIYIPVSILWTIQINWLQWALVIVAAVLSGSVLLSTLMPALRFSRHKLVLSLGVIGCHLLLATGFMLYFFHDPHSSSIIIVPVTELLVTQAVNSTEKL